MIAFGIALAAPSAGAAMLPPEADECSPARCESGESCKLSEICGMPADCKGRTDCRVTVRPIGNDTCLIECTDENGATQSWTAECEESSCEKQRECPKTGSACAKP